MVKYEHNLSSMDFRLYDYLKTQTDWVTQKDIALALPEVFPCRIEDMEDFHNSSCRHEITNSIRRLNESGYVHKIILSGSRGVKIANSEEFDIYIGSNINSIVRRLKRFKKLAEKAGYNNQYRLKLSDYQQEIYNSFLDDDRYL